MSFEKYTQFYDGNNTGMTIRPLGKAAELNFAANVKEDKRYRLFTVGETEQFYMWKNEPDSPQLYRMITDSLDVSHAIKDRYCLNLSCDRAEDYIKRVYKKIPWPPMLSYLKMTPVPEMWNMGITVSAKELRIYDGGFLRMRIDVRLKKEGVDPRSVSGKPDDSIVIDFPEGTYMGNRLVTDVKIPKNTAHVGVFVEGRGYCGECYVEAPFLSAIGQNLLPAFSESTPGKPQFEWVGQYLSRKEWPSFCVRLNGEIIFKGEIFERCHRFSEWEIDIPRELLRADNKISYELISAYHDPLPYTIYEAGLIEQEGGELAVIAVSEGAFAGGKARVLVRTEKPDMRVRFESLDGRLGGCEEWHFKEKGLHGILLDCYDVCQNARFRLTSGELSADGCVGRIIIRGDDGVVTGTGDMVYVHQDADSMEEYLSWFLSNNIGDFITVRPVYRWSGTRTLNKDLWKYFCRLMKELDLKYVLMRDGREVEGLCTQPDAHMLDGDGFYGIQMHEVDNTYYYGGLFREISSLYDEMVDDLFAFAYSEDPEHSSSMWNVSDDQKFVNGVMCNGYSRSMDWSYSELRERSIAAMRKLRRESDTRHTGPSAMFKYMADAGFTQLGAETMYNTMEPLMGFLRGVAKDRGMPTYGVHHAVQWSTTPHNTPARYRRYRLALYASYLLGATDINTEEGLWHMEEYFEHHHRFGEACSAHLEQQRDFYRYVSSHTRSGRLYSPLALIHGRDDGVTFFGKDRTWGRRNLPQSPADDSWDLLKVIYPMSRPVDRMYIHNCPDDEPQGYHSGTPYGNIDAVPMEGKYSTLKDHRTLVFLGYNRYEADDAEKLMRYVNEGGRILLTRAHLTTSDEVEAIFSGDLAFSEGPASFCQGVPSFVKTTYRGEELSVCVNADAPDEILEYTDRGEPLVCVYRRQNGTVILFNTKEYPSHKAINELYASMMKALLIDEAARESVWAEGADNVEFAVYEQADGTRHIYFLATDWFRDPCTLRLSTLRLGDERYDVAMPFGVLIKCVTDGRTAAWAESEDGEVISVNDGCIRVQGSGKVGFRIARNGTVKAVSVDFDSSPVKILDI